MVTVMASSNAVSTLQVAPISPTTSTRPVSAGSRATAPSPTRPAHPPGVLLSAAIITCYSVYIFSSSFSMTSPSGGAAVAVGDSCTQDYVLISGGSCAVLSAQYSVRSVLLIPHQTEPRQWAGPPRLTGTAAPRSCRPPPRPPRPRSTPPGSPTRSHPSYWSCPLFTELLLLQRQR